MNGHINPFLIRKWIFGMPAPFWLKNIKMIEQVIREQKLEPVPAESLMTETPLAPMGAEQEKAIRIWPRPIPGGIRIPHLHFRGDVYLLNESQWKEFSGKVVKEFQTKLARVNTVSFEQVMEISEAVDSLG
ncbi:MAG: hypothetical protein OHK0032_16670 [Thermodesulfovibrionales bacterium]